MSGDGDPQGVPDLRRIMAELRASARAKDAELPPSASANGVELKYEYAIAEITAFDGEAFVRRAYRSILRREPDDAGLAFYMRLLRDGGVDKVGLVHLLVDSEEAKWHGVRVRGLVADASLPSRLSLKIAGRPGRKSAAVPASGSYPVQELLAFEDRAFVENAYTAILRRLPDADGLETHLTSLREGRAEKIDVLANLRGSTEGRAAGVKIDGLRARHYAAIARRIPVIGGVFAVVQYVMSLHGIVKRLDWLEGALWRQGVATGDLGAEVSTLAGRVEREIDWFAKRGVSRQELAERLQRRDRNMAILRAGLVSQWRGNRDRMEALFASLGAKAGQADLEALQREVQSTLADTSLQLSTSIGALLREVGVKAELADARFTEIEQAAVTHTRLVDASLEAAKQKLDDHGARLDELARSTPGGRSKSPSGTRLAELDSLYVSLENRFRGTREEIKRRAEVFLPLVSKSAAGSVSRPVLDIGCGRGEWLELLREKKLAARGVDLNQAMVDECVARGLVAECGDALAWLRQAEPGSLGAITAFHVIEHLSKEDLLDLIDLSLAALRPGGIIIFETPNPENVVVGACNFYMDPTHNRPLPPQLMQFLVEARGFSDASVLRLGNLSAGLPEPFPPGHAKEKYNPFVHALRHNFFSPPDYAVTARKR